MNTGTIDVWLGSTAAPPKAVEPPPGPGFRDQLTRANPPEELNPVKSEVQKGEREEPTIEPNAQSKEPDSKPQVEENTSLMAMLATTIGGPPVELETIPAQIEIQAMPAIIESAPGVVASELQVSPITQALIPEAISEVPAFLAGKPTPEKPTYVENSSVTEPISVSNGKALGKSERVAVLAPEKLVSSKAEEAAHPIQSSFAVVEGADKTNVEHPSQPPVQTTSVEPKQTPAKIVEVEPRPLQQGVPVDNKSTIKNLSVEAKLLESEAVSVPIRVETDSSTDSNPLDLKKGSQQSLVQVPTFATRTSDVVEGPVLDKPVLNKILAQVSDRIEQLAASKPKGGVTILLEPRELGSITIQVKKSGDSVEANITASNDQVRQSLVQNKQHLSEALVNKGLNLDSVNVGVGDKSRQAQQQSQGQSQRQHGHASQAGSSQREVTDHSRSLRTNGNVDIWI